VLPSHSGAFGSDPALEWFPVLAQRPSLATAQGSEWLAGGAFFNRLQALESLRGCATQDAACIEKWRPAREPNTRDVSTQYIYVPKEIAAPPGERIASTLWRRARESYRRDARYKLVFENDGAAIFKVNGFAAR
jgi:hypothetical protein